MVLGKKKSIGIIAAIFIVLVVALMGVVVVSLYGSDSASSLQYMHSQQAFFVAETGLQYYLQKLKDQVSSWATPPAAPVNEAYGSGHFTIITSNAQPNTITVISTARVNSIDGQVAKRVVKMDVTRRSGPGNVPKAFYYNQFTTQNSNLQNAVNSTITGDLAAGKFVNGEGDWTLNGNVYEGVTVNFPFIDFAAYQVIATHVENSNFTFGPNQTYSGIYYVRGDAEIKNGVTINGSVICEGNISFVKTNNITVKPSLNYPALAAGKTIDGKRVTNLNVTGLLYAEKGFNLRNANSVTIYGTIVTDANLIISNVSNVSLTFNGDILSNPPPYFQAGVGGLWDEVY